MLPHALGEEVSRAEVFTLGVGKAVQRRQVDRFSGRQVLLRAFHNLVASRRPVPEMAQVRRTAAAGVGGIADLPGAVVEHPGPGGEGRKLREQQEEEAEITQYVRESGVGHGKRRTWTPMKW